MHTHSPKFPLLFASIWSGLICYGQNLIPNPGFENITDCTFGAGYGQLYDWRTLDCAGIPMACNACNVPLYWSIGVPQNNQGYEYPASGDGYAGIGTYVHTAVETNPAIYINVDLTGPLVAGEEYCIRLNLSLMDSSSFKTGALHCFLWYGEPTTCNYQDTAWDTNAAVTFDITGVDANGWYFFEDNFIADGGEDNLTIGSFSYGPEIATAFLEWNQLGYYAGYYIDDAYLGNCDNGIDDRDNRSLRISPVPALAGQPVLVAFGQEVGAAVIEVVDVQGRLVSRRRVEAGTQITELNTDGLLPGHYTVRLQSGTAVWAGALTIL